MDMTYRQFVHCMFLVGFLHKLGLSAKISGLSSVSSQHINDYMNDPETT